MTDFDPNFTAYALGELNGETDAATRARIEGLLRTDPAAAAFVAATREAATALTAGLRTEPSLGIGEERLQALLDDAAFDTTGRLPTGDETAGLTPSDPSGTPLYHVITHPAAEPRHWRRTLLAVAAAVAIVASTLTAILSSVFHRANPTIVADKTNPEPARSFPPITLRPGTGGAERATGERDGGGLPNFSDGTLWTGKPPRELVPDPDASLRPPPFGPGTVVLVTPFAAPLATPLPTTGESTAPETGYAVTLENPFVDVAAAPLSAIPLHPGRGSYAGVKRAIASGHLPAKESVRVEELVNALPYHYPAPANGDTFAGDLEAAGCPWNESHRLVRIGLRARAGTADEIVARAASVRVEFNPATVAAYRLIGYDRRLTTRPGDRAAADPDVLAGYCVTALYEIIPAPAVVTAGDLPPLKYQAPGGLTPAAESGDLLTVTLRYQVVTGRPALSPSLALSQAFTVRDGGGSCFAASVDFQLAAAAAGFGLVLRDSPHKGTATLETVLALATPSLGDDELGARAEFVELVKKHGS